jgi:hypothetical protein
MATPTTLPASFTAGQVLTASQMNNLRGAFRVLQVVQGSTTTITTNATSTYADTTLTATITPSSATSQILCFVSHPSCYKSSANTENRMALRLVRGSTTIYQIANELGITNTAMNLLFACSATYLDSPATTSATTYKTTFMNAQNTGTVITQTGNVASTLILAEISA